MQELQKALFKLEFNLRKVDVPKANDIESMLKIVKFMNNSLLDLKDNK